jgi:lysine-specific demethylase 8
MSYSSSQHHFPRTLDALILHLLSPVGVEVLTRKFDEIDQQTTEGDRYLSKKLFLKGNKNLPLIFVFALQFVIFYFRNKFYQGFYGAFDDQFAAMDAVLNGKELFAHWVIFFSS